MWAFYQPAGLPSLPPVLRENRGPWGWAKTVKQAWRGNPGRYHAGMLHHADNWSLSLAEAGVGQGLRGLEQADIQRGAKPF